MRKIPFVLLLLIIMCSCTNLQGKNTTEAEQNIPQTARQDTNSANSGQLTRKNGVTPDHVVIVVEENHSEQNIIGNSSAPYMNSLVKQGAYFSQSYGNYHPSQPNYLMLFSGSNQGIRSDTCGFSLESPNLASELIKLHYTFSGYSEDLPSVGSTVCSHKKYARKHSPWVNFTNIPKSVNLTFADFPSDYSKLPTVSFVIPNLDHDMHDGTIKTADDWLKKNIGPYVDWAKNHNSLFILTWDEDDFGRSNHIPTIIVGDNVRQANLTQKITHLNVLRLLEDMYHLPYLGQTSKAEPIKNLLKQ